MAANPKPSLGGYSASGIGASKKPEVRTFQYSKKENLVAILHSDHVLLQGELEKVLAQMSEKGIVYDRLVNDCGRYFEFYRSSYELVEL